MKAYDRVQVVSANLFPYKVMAWSRTSRDWKCLSYHNFLWTAKLAARNAARIKANHPSISGVFYEVNNVSKTVK